MDHIYDTYPTDHRRKKVKPLVVPLRRAEDIYESPPYNTQGGDVVFNPAREREASVRRTIGGQLIRDPETLKRTDHFVNDLRADTKDLKQIFDQLGDEFGIKILEADRVLLVTVSKTYDFIHAQVAG